MKISSSLTSTTGTSSNLSTQPANRLNYPRVQKQYEQLQTQIQELSIYRGNLMLEARKLQGTEQDQMYAQVRSLSQNIHSLDQQISQLVWGSEGAKQVEQ